MRTKHILTALALPALFAACTADEFETVNQNTGLQEERAKVAENFTLLTSGIQTRYSVENGDKGISFNFEKGDRIGAAIVDQKGENDVKPEDFDVIYSLAGNYPFEFKGNDQWQSYTQLGIGHYLFIYPYNASDNNRAAMAYELPVVQELGEGEEGLNAAIEKGNKAIAAAILHEGEESVDISLKNLFAYPKLTINFDNGENVTTVSQIVLRANDTDDDGTIEKPFIVKGGFDHMVVSELFNLDEEKGSEIFGTEKDDFYKYDKTTEKYSIDWNLVDTKDFLLKEGGEGFAYNPFKDETCTSDYIIVKFPEGTKVKPAANTDNKYVEARIMMPSIEDFTALKDEYTLYVYTDNGVYHVAFNEDAIAWSDRTNKDAKKAAFARSTSYGLTLKALNTELNKGEDAGTIVTTLADWNDLVDRFGDTKQNQKIIIVGDDFAFDGAENIEWPETCTFTITTDVKVKGNVEMKNVNVDGTINVEKGATLTVNNTLTAEKEEVEFADGTTLPDIETVIKNEGTVVIAAEYDKAKFEDNNKVKDYYVGVSAIENKGTLIVNKEAKAEFALTNVQKSVVTNNGEVKLANYTDLADGKNFAGNNGTINNNGTLRTDNFTNVAPEIDDKGTNNEEDDVIKNTPVINNAKGARMVAEGDFTNYATLVNEGTLACLNTTTGSITNNEVLDSKKGAVTYITDNTKGKVIVYEAKPLTVTINSSSKGIVEYETSAKSEDFKESLVNQVIASGDLTIADGTISMLIFKGDATLTLAKLAGTSTKEGVINGLTIEEGNVVLASDVTVSTLIIKEEGSLNVPSNITMTYNGEDATNFNNEGLILVGGTFSAEKVNMADGGDVQNNGGEITWAESAAVEEAEENHTAAMKKMVQAQILYSSRTDWASVYTAITNGSWSGGSTGTTVGGTWEGLLADAVKYYNAWKGTTYSDDQYLANVYRAATGGAKAIAEAYEKASKANVKTAFNKVYPDNTWITAAGNGIGDYGTFIRNSDKETVTAQDIKTESNGVIANFFAQNAVKIEKDKVDVSTNTDAVEKAVENQSIWLTMQSLGENGKNVELAYIPEYSYICVYEGADEYDVIAGLKKLATDLKGSTETKLDKVLDNYTSLKAVREAISQIKDAVDGNLDGLTSYDKQLATRSNLDDYNNTVWDWKFTDGQISTLNSKVK